MVVMSPTAMLDSPEPAARVTEVWGVVRRDEAWEEDPSCPGRLLPELNDGESVSSMIEVKSIRALSKSRFSKALGMGPDSGKGAMGPDLLRPAGSRLRQGPF